MIENSLGFILSRKRLQKMNDSKLIEVHFGNPTEPGEREVKLVAVSECRKAIHDFTAWSQEAFDKIPLKRSKT
jgi:TusA-related sulfurtransferase